MKAQRSANGDGGQAAGDWTSGDTTSGNRIGGGGHTNYGTETGKVGGAMMERNGLAVVGKQGGKKAAAAATQTGTGLREGTTGQIVTTLARVWAVAAPHAADGAEAAGIADPDGMADADGMAAEPTEIVRGKVIPLDVGRAAMGRVAVNRAAEDRLKVAPGRGTAQGKVIPLDAGRAAMGRAAAGRVGVDRQTVELPEFEVRFYRKYTEALLQRYMQMTMEAGRVPSMMGREVLGGRASRYRIHGFDDAVNFRLDVERCLGRLDGKERELLRRVTLQEYTQAEAAALIGISLRTCVQRYGRALDKLTGILLEMRLLEPFKALSRG